MEVKKIPSSYERQQVYKMASKLGYKVYSFSNFEEDDSGAIIPVGNPEKKYALCNENLQPIVPYKLTFWELKDKLIFLGGTLEEVI